MAGASTLLVTTTADGGAGSLRAAIANAISGDTIQFQVGGTITLASELPVIAKNLTIDGNGNNPTISGAGTYRPFFIGDAGTTGSTYAVTLKNLAIADAVAQGGAGVGAGAGAGLGGAIFVSRNGALTLANVAVSNTQAKGGSVVDNPSQVGGGGGMGGKSAPYTPGGGGGLFVGSDAPGSSDGGGPNPGLSNNVASGPATGGAGGFASGGGGASSNGGPVAGGAGGFGGGGGSANAGGNTTGGHGGYGGGGGSAAGSAVSIAGNGGFGGGGGGGQSSAGAGGFGAGQGSSGPYGNNSGGGGLGAGGAIFVQSGGTVTVQGDLSQAAGSVAGGTGRNGGTDGSAFGSGIFFQGTSGTTTTLGFGAGNQTIADAVTDYIGSGGTNPAGGTNLADQGGSVAISKSGGGTLTLLGANSYRGGTTVNGGVLNVEGSLGGPTAVNSGALMGSGSVGAISVNAGGTFAPGNGMPGGSMAVNGSLAFQSGAIYLVQLNPSTAAYASVNGTAQLGGATVVANFAAGSYVAKRYTILTASGGVSGTFSPVIVSASPPSNVHGSLSYGANDVYLDLILSFGIPSGLNGNQQRVGDALTNAFNANGGIAAVYAALTPGGLTQASGEPATGSQQTTFNAMSQFLGLLTDPGAQRDGGPGSAGGAAGFVEEDQASAYAAGRRTDAFAMLAKAPTQRFAQRWSVWAAGFGGSQSTNGNATDGSNDMTSRIAGTAVGADYWLAPNTKLGFALAGGGTSFGVNALGSGRSDLFQAGAYLRHSSGPAYLSAALAYGWQDITTDRTVTIAGTDRLRAEFNANAYSGRLEGGYRFIAPWVGGIGLTPYGAAQFTTFDLPAYTEQVISGTGAFALNYASKSVTDTRGELGLRGDKALALRDGVLTLRGRLAWAHDFNPDRSAAATFQALPLASFVVDGSAQARDAALTTASVEMRWMNGWSAAATFEGEFSNVTRSYAGKGSVRYGW
ncbi:MAG: autotransporter domain-containing protein [Bradyrhizobiaceae bacterium]|nr:MAG: autotransporter domain-containing protein [Bradyrhizobiaceae bacterium]